MLTLMPLWLIEKAVASHSLYTCCSRTSVPIDVVTIDIFGCELTYNMKQTGLQIFFR